MLENIELLENRVPEKLTAHQLDLLAAKISKKCDSWSEASRTHVSEIEKIRKYIYISQKGEHTEGDPYALPAVYKLNEAIKAHIKENVYATNAGIFDVKGDDEKSQETANLHKWDIVKDLEKIDFKNVKANAFLKNFNEAGEMIALVGLSTKTVKRKTEVEVPETITGFNEEKIETVVTKIGLMDIEIHDGIEVFPIKSEDFYFDTTKIDRFDSPVCGKITRKWLSYSEIVNNKAYDLLNRKEYGRDAKKYLKESIKKQEPDYQMLRQDQGLWETNREMFRGDQAEVLEYWGDITVESKELKNYLITMIGNKIVRCEPNPYYNCPFVYYAKDIHPKYKRGISPLRVALKPADITSNITNEIIEAFPYIGNPVKLSPRGSVINKKQKPPPGGNIEYEADLNKNPPIPIDVSGVLKGFDLIQFFDHQTQLAVGMSDTMLGVETEKKETATETKSKMIGGSVRVSDIIDGIKQGFNILVIRKIADLKANFEEGDIPLGIPQDDGGIKQETVTDTVRRGKYHYTYIDSKATLERQAQFKEFLRFLELILKIQPYAINLSEVIKHGVSEIGIQDGEKFLNKDKLEEAIRDILARIGMEVNPNSMEMAKGKIIEYLPEIVRRIIEDEQSARIEEAISNEGMGAMPSDIQRGGVPEGGGLYS